MEDFFTQDVVDMAENHAEAVRGLETKEADRIMKLYKRVRQDLRDRLDTLPSGSFSAQHARSALLQVEQALAEMNRILTKEMGDSGTSAAELGVKHLIKEIKTWDREFIGAATPISLDAVRIATDTKNFLFNKYEASISSYSESLRSRIANGIAQSAVEGVTADELIGRLGRTMLGEEWRLQRMVRTELQGVYSLGKLNGMLDLRENEMPDLMKTLYHPMDNRTGKDSKWLNSHNPIVPVDEPFDESSTGKEVIYMYPPNRPNDRAIMIPYRKAWAK